MRLDDIQLDPDLQPRVHIDAELQKDYAELMRSGTVFPPVVVFSHDGLNLLVDGFHRYHASRTLCRDEVDVVVHDGDRQAALRYSLAANAEHGQRRQPGDYQRAYNVGVANKLFDAADPAAVASVLRCSRAWSFKVTETARGAQIAAVDRAIRDGKAAGKNNSEIARNLNLPRETVRDRVAANPARTIRRPSGAKPVQKSEPPQTGRIVPPALLARFMGGRASVVATAKIRESPRRRRWRETLAAFEGLRDLPSVDDLFADIEPEMLNVIGGIAEIVQDYITAFNQLRKVHDVDDDF